MALFVAVLFFVLVGVAESGLFFLLFKVRGYTFGLVPSAILGLSIAASTLLFGSNIGLWVGVIVGSLGNFFNVGTLSHPLPVDYPIVGFKLRLPAIVALIGGLAGVAIPVILEKMDLLPKSHSLGGGK